MTGLRALGASGLDIGPLVLGGNVFGWTIKDDAESFRVLDRFVERGGTMIDTADIYSAWVPGNSGGDSEKVIGAWLKASGKRGKVQIATKVGLMDGTGGKGLEPARILAAADESLARLGIETIDLYFAHRDDLVTPHEDVLGAFDTLIKAGKVRAIAASNYSGKRLKQALDVATRDGLPHFRALQPQYNLVSRHEFEGELQDLCVTHNIGVVPYYALAAGFLTGKYRTAEDLKQSARGNRMGNLLEGKGAAVLGAMDAVAAETGAPMAHIALAWLAAQPGVTAPIASATSIAQLDQLMDYQHLALSKDQVDRLTSAGA